MSMTLARGFGIAALVAVAAGALLQAFAAVSNSRDHFGLFFRGGALIRLAYVLAALSLAEPARAARDPAWVAVPVLSALALVPFAMVMVAPMGLPVVTPWIRLLYILGPVAVALAALRAARARGVPLGLAAYPLAIAYVAALVAQASSTLWVEQLGMPFMMLYSLSSGLVPLLLVAILVVALPAPWRRARVAGVALAALGALTVTTSMLVLYGLRGPRSFPGVEPLVFAVSAAGVSVVVAGIALLALDAAAAHDGPAVITVGTSP